MQVYRKPFTSGAFYLAPALWLEDIRQPRDLDARDLLLSHHVPPGDVIAFPEERPSAYWVRENDDGLPSLLSQPTFRAYRSMLLDPARPGGPLLVPCPEHRECYHLVHWPHFQHKPIYFRPKAYMENRWPVWLGNQWPARVALVGLMALMAKEPKSEADDAVSVEAAAGEIRQAAAAALPGVDVARHVRTGLRALQRLSLVQERDGARRGVTYRHVSTVFARSPQIAGADIAARCALDPATDAHWIALIAAFLRHNNLLLDDAPRLWQKILAYDRHINTAEDAHALVAELAARAGHASTAVTRVLNEYAHRVASEQRLWLLGSAVAVTLASATQLSADLTMPELHGEHTRLQATQLLIRFRLSGRITAEAAAAALEGTQIDILQPPNAVPVTAHLHANRAAISHGARLNCNHLHRAVLDYAQPFRLLVRTPHPERRLTLHCQFRVMTT